MSQAPLRLFVISHTHWDREWYRTFQEFRLQLIDVIDHLLDVLDSDPEFKSFLLDGQTIVLEDYLEIRPEREADIRRLIAEGRLIIGPWHILPDEWLVSPEATVRNLMLGARVSSAFGSRMPIGYTPDPFGHISQLPQILVGVGLDTACLQRGLADEPIELLWEAPDGTRVFLPYMRFGYGNLSWVPPSAQSFTHAVQRQIDRMRDWTQTNILLLMNGTDHGKVQGEIPALIAAANERLAGQAVLEHGTLPQYVAALREALGDKIESLPVVRGELRDSKRNNLLPGVLSTRMWIKQRNGASQTKLERYAEPLSAVAGFLTAPADETRAQALRRNRHGELWKAWRYLIENHPHDSICGCSIDEVCNDMLTRFEWVDQIADGVTVDALRVFAAQINTASLPRGNDDSAEQTPTHAVIQGQGDKAIIVYNPISSAATNVVTLDVPWAGAGRTYQLLDAAGAEVPYRWHTQTGWKIDQQRTMTNDELMAFISDLEVGFYVWRLVRDVRVWLAPDGKSARMEVVFPEYHTGEIGDFAQLANDLRRDMANVESCDVTMYLAGFDKLSFVAQDVPGVGYATYRLANVSVDGDTVAQEAETLANTRIENEYFVVQVDAVRGTLAITDKLTGTVYNGGNVIEDTADRGDEYNYAPLADEPYGRLIAESIAVEAFSDGVETTLRIDAQYEVPRALTPDRLARSAATVNMPITTYATLKPGVRRVDLRVELTNDAKDHRVRVLFPTPIQSETAIADGHYDRVKRVPFRDYDPAEYGEQPMPTAPMQAFVAVTDENGGALLAAKGLPEYELIPPSEGQGATLALTLLRGVDWISREDFPEWRKGHAGPESYAPGGQCLGDHVFEYSFVPFGGDFALDDAAQAAYQFVAPVYGQVVPIAEGALAPVAAVVSLAPSALVLTALKPAENGDGMIVRFYNSSESSVEGRIEIGVPARQVTAVNLLEEAQGAAQALDAAGGLTLDVPAKRIVTLLVQ